MPEDYVTAHNTKIIADEAKEAESPKAESVHNITKHQVFAADGTKVVYHVDHTVGKVYVEGERGLIRYSSDNVAQVSQYAPFDDSTTPHRAYIKHVDQNGFVSYTDLGNQPYVPIEGDVEYKRDENGVAVKADGSMGRTQ